MTILMNSILADRCLPVKYTLTCYRALHDAKLALKELEITMQQDKYLLSNWKVRWIGICAVLRTSFEVIGKVDARSCINQKLRHELELVWRKMSEHKDDYALFWEFLKKERDEVLHQYEWKAYGAWLDKESGDIRPQLSLLDVARESEQMVLFLRRGHFKGQNSMELLRQCAELVEELIFGAIKKAGYEPNEEVYIRDFVKVVDRPDRKHMQRMRDSEAIRRSLISKKSSNDES